MFSKHIPLEAGLREICVSGATIYFRKNRLFPMTIKVCLNSTIFFFKYGNLRNSIIRTGAELSYKHVKLYYWELELSTPRLA